MRLSAEQLLELSTDGPITPAARDAAIKKDRARARKAARAKAKRKDTNRATAFCGGTNEKARQDESRESAGGEPSRRRAQDSSPASAVAVLARAIRRAFEREGRVTDEDLARTGLAPAAIKRLARRAHERARAENPALFTQEIAA